MSDVFPRWTNGLLGRVLLCGLLLGAAVVVGVGYYGTPKYSRVGYEPVQPVGFSHRVHAGELGLDCRYCHSGVERSWFAGVPSAEVCMNCHNQVLREDSRLALVRESFAGGEGVPWVQVHRVPDYVYFDHSVHVNRGFSCVECHGRVDEMDEVFHAESFGMAFCLECHRDPAGRIRPLEGVMDLGWVWSEDGGEAARLQRVEGERLVHEWGVESLVNCSACHR